MPLPRTRYHLGNEPKVAYSLSWGVFPAISQRIARCLHHGFFIEATYLTKGDDFLGMGDNPLSFLFGAVVRRGS